MPLPPSGLLCELLRDPAQGLITTATPRFAWVVEDPARGARQAAYQILVASRAGLLQPGAADLWDSGRVESARSLHIPYAGSPLPTDGPCWWAVRTWDAAGVAGGFSAPQRIQPGDPARDAAWPGESRWQRIEDDLGVRWLPERRQALQLQPRVPATCRTLADGRVLASFAKAAFATLELRLTAEDERTLEIRLGEKTLPDGSVDPAPGGCIAYRVQQLRLRPGTHTYRLVFPRLRCPMPGSLMLAEHMPEVAPFRHVEIIGAPSPVVASDLRQLALVYPYDDAASAFACDDERLNRVHDLCRYSLQTLTFLGIYADGARERCPYEADAYIQQLGHYAVDREFAIARHSAAFLLEHGTWPTEWILISVFMAWADYLHTGDRQLLERCHGRIAARALHALAREDGLLVTSPERMTAELRRSVGLHLNEMRDIVDWPHGGARPGGPAGPTSTLAAGEIDSYVFTPVNTVVNAHHIHALALMARISEALERPEEATEWRRREELARTSFNRVLFDEARGVYRDGEGTDHASLHANMFPLCFGLVPPERRAPVIAFIKSRGMACSCYAAHYLLDGLCAHGEVDHALDLMTAGGDRGWLHMLAVGSTITTEAWDLRYKPNLGWSHAWSTAPANIAARRLLGVEPLAPGYAQVRIRPRPGRLAHVAGTVPTIRGPITVACRRDGAGLGIVVTLPANLDAEIHLPCADPAAVSEGGRPASESPGIAFLRHEDGCSVFRVGGGSYAFRVPA